MVWEYILRRWSVPQFLVAVLGMLLAVILLVDVNAAINGSGYLSASDELFNYTGRWVLLFVLRQIDVRSLLVETLFLAWASLWLVMSVLFLWQPVRLRFVMIVLALLSFWYFPIGSWIGVVIIVLLAWTKVQHQ